MTKTQARTAVRTLQGPAVLRPKETKALLAVPDRRTRQGKRDLALISLMVLGCLRATEARRLTVDNIEWGEPTRIMIRSLKSGRHRTVTLPRQAQRALKAWIDASRPTLYVFPGKYGDALSLRETQRIVKGALGRIGRGELRAHSLRHTGLSTIVRKTGSIYVAMRVAGHSSPTVTARSYAAWDTQDADRAAKAIDEVIG